MLEKEKNYRKDQAYLGEERRTSSDFSSFSDYQAGQRDT
jgi:hypothetical protein